MVSSYFNKMMKLQYLPVATTIWFLSTFIITYIIAVKTGSVYYLFPYISEAGALPPASCVFSQFLNLGALLLLFAMYVRYRQVEHDIKTQNIKLNSKWNSVTFKVGIAVSFGTSITANFQESNILIVHLIGALMALGIGSVYCILQTRISHAYVSACKRSIPKWMFYLRLLLTVPMVPVFMLIFLSGVLGMTKFTGESKMWWTEEHEGYNLRLTSTFSEWILALIIFTYISTFSNEIKCIEFEGVQLKIDGKDVNEYQLQD
uniref:CWH43-like N-terminal domain-containing protein n=2 Tax=Photinus pyralis TaxID=7054 RepID=A0A1Y1L878_PHOPY